MNAGFYRPPGIAGGQRVFVIPSVDLVVVLTAGLYKSPLQGTLTSDILNDVVLPAMH